MVLVIEASRPARWRPKLERVGAMRWRVIWLWFAVARIDVRGINELLQPTR